MFYDPLSARMVFATPVPSLHLFRRCAFAPAWSGRRQGACAGLIQRLAEVALLRFFQSSNHIVETRVGIATGSGWSLTSGRPDVRLDVPTSGLSAWTRREGTPLSTLHL